MFGFLLKIGIVAIFIGGLGFVVVTKKDSLPSPSNFKADVLDTVNNIDTKQVAQNLSDTLDGLVSNQKSDSAVVLGAKISNESIGKIVDTLQSLPPEQVNQIKSLLCAPLNSVPTETPQPSSTP